MIEADPDFSTADLHDAAPEAVEVVNLQFRSFGARTRFCGEVETLRVPSDHSAVRDAVTAPGRGRVLVVDSAGDLTTGVLGDRIAGRAAQEGWAGVVVIGAIRDSCAVNRLPIGVKALGTTARRSSDERPGERGVVLEFGDVRCRPGDWLYADEDAVLVSRRPLVAEGGR